MKMIRKKLYYVACFVFYTAMKDAEWELGEIPASNIFQLNVDGVYSFNEGVQQ